MSVLQLKSYSKKNVTNVITYIHVAIKKLQQREKMVTTLQQMYVLQLKSVHNGKNGDECSNLCLNCNSKVATTGTSRKKKVATHLTNSLTIPKRYLIIKYKN